MNFKEALQLLVEEFGREKALEIGEAILDGGISGMFDEIRKERLEK